MKIAIFCGSAMGSEPAFIESAKILGDWIGACGHTLIYGGGEAGLMGITARAAFEGGAKVIGVIPENVSFIATRPQPYCTQLVKTPDMSSRKKYMLEAADLFIALPGGIGTMDEMTEAITLNRIGTFHKKCVFLNTKWFYEPMRQMLCSMIDAGFLEKQVFDYVAFDAPDKYEAELEEMHEKANACKPIPTSIAASESLCQSLSSDDKDGEVTELASGSCGPDLTWLLTSDGVLTISGSGPMDDYETYMRDEFFAKSYKKAPWYDLRDQITAIRLEEGPASIGSCAFYDCSKATEVTLPQSLTAINWYAFTGCDGLKEVSIPDKVSRIEASTFARCNGLLTVGLPAGIAYIGETAFTITDFNRSSSLVALHYAGSIRDWREITVEEGNDIRIVYGK